MFRRHWGLFLATGLSLAVSAWLYVVLKPGQPNLPVYEYGRGAAHDDHAGRSACQPSVLAAIRDRRESARERDRCTQEAEQHRLQSNDLVQQTRAANGAEAQARLAYQLAWMGVYGTIGGFLTLVAAAAAALYARMAARAANEGLAHAKEATNAELRPWLELKVSGDRLRVNKKAATVTFELAVRNIGKLPAVNVYREASLFNFGPEQETAIPEFFDSKFSPWPGARARTILPEGKIELDGVATMPRNELEISGGDGGPNHLFLVLAIRVVYGWESEGAGQTCQSFSVFEIRTNRTPDWRPVQIDLEREDLAYGVSLRAARFDNIR